MPIEYLYNILCSCVAFFLARLVKTGLDAFSDHPIQPEPCAGHYHRRLSARCLAHTLRALAALSLAAGSVGSLEALRVWDAGV